MHQTTLLTALAALHITTTTSSSVWTVNCAPLTQQRSDPITSPGLLSSHVHSVVGSTAFSRTMNGAHAAANGHATTCDKYTDHSSYWAPSLYRILPNGKFKLLPFTGMVAYYENYTCSYNPHSPGTCPEISDAIAFPTGLRMLAGDTDRRSFNPASLRDQAILMETGNNGEVTGMPSTLDGSRLSGHARFPSCWDGHNLDSADHKSHVSYPSAKLGGDTQGGMCPPSHPVAMLNIGAQFGWSLDGITDPSELVFANGDTTAYGFHADFIAGWKNREALQESFANCFDNGNCPWRSFGTPDGSEPVATPRLPETRAPVEDIGLRGAIGKLPGRNPVFGLSRVFRRGGFERVR